MRIILRVLGIVIGHFAAACCVAWSEVPWPANIAGWLPMGILFAVVGFPILAIEIPAAIVIYVVYDALRSLWAKRVTLCLLLALCGLLGPKFNPISGADEPYHCGSIMAGAVFAAIVWWTASKSRRPAVTSIRGTPSKE